MESPSIPVSIVKRSSASLVALAVMIVAAPAASQPRPFGEPARPAIRRPLVPSPLDRMIGAESSVAAPVDAPVAEGPVASPVAESPIASPVAESPVAAPVPTPAVPLPTEAPGPPASPAPAPDPDRAAFTLSGWTDLYYSYNLNEPSNDVNALRLYDARHNHIGFNSLGLALDWRLESLTGRAILQFGTLATEFFYPATDLLRAQQELPWRIVQEATIAWSPRLRGRRPLTLEGGIFVAPFGAESLQIYKNWCWSVSNLFFLMPFQISGVRASWAINERWTLRAGVYSGWDRVVDDNNPAKSVLLQAEYQRGDEAFVSVQYMVGAERDRAAREGPGARHTLDAYGELRVTERLQLRAQVFAGAEPNRLGLNAWAAAALHARWKVFDWLYLAGRGDVVAEWIPSPRPGDPAGGASLFGLPDASPYASITGTAELLPHRHLSVRLEFRHDGARGGLFYRGSVPVSGSDRTPVLNAASQNTVTLGATAWF